MGFAKQRIRLLLCLNDTSRFVRTKTLVTRLHFQRTRNWPQRQLASKIFCVRYTSATAKTGGASRDRTDDPLLAKQVLSQLSYGPVS